jgi:hypothetical protein
MKWIYEQSLTEKAKKALNKGQGEHSGFMVHVESGKRYIAEAKNQVWFLVVKGSGGPIIGIEA